MTTSNVRGRFLRELARWTTWVASHVVSSERAIKIAGFYPAGARHNMNLYRDREGNVWCEYGLDNWHLCHRPVDDPELGNYIKEYQFTSCGRSERVGETRRIPKPDGTFLELAYRSWELWEPWGWERSDPYYPGGTLEHYQQALSRDIEGLRVSRILSARADEVQEWIRETGREQGETRRDLRGRPNVWVLFEREFCRMDQVPDPGALMCALNSEVDFFACGKVLFGYCH